MAARGFAYVDARPEAEAAWTNFVREGQKNLLMGDIKSWFTGVNTNIDGRDKPRVVLYVGSASAYRERCDEVKNGGYREFEFLESSHARKEVRDRKSAVKGTSVSETARRGGRS